jgi:hypothetical protein
MDEASFEYRFEQFWEVDGVVRLLMAWRRKAGASTR